MILQQKARGLGVLTALGGGVLAFALRILFLLGSGGAEIGLWILTVIIVGWTFLLSRTLKSRPVYTDGFSSDRGWLVPSMFGCAGLIIGNGIQLFLGTSGVDTLIAYLGLVAGAAMAVIAIKRTEGKVMSLWVHAVITIFLVIKLIFDFRDWSVDPTLMDYCFSLFAAICAMLANCHIGYFVLNKGDRKSTVFWCLLATVFGLSAMADGDIATRLMLGGMAAWTLANGGQLLEN